MPPKRPKAVKPAIRRITFTPVEIPRQWARGSGFGSAQLAVGVIDCICLQFSQLLNESTTCPMTTMACTPAGTAARFRLDSLGPKVLDSLSIEIAHLVRRGMRVTVSPPAGASVSKSAKALKASFGRVRPF
jgi:hypothetical protein